MQTALFTYRRRVIDNKTNEEAFNDNYVNPMNVISFFWQANDDQKMILSVFLANNYTLTFGEVTGQKFVQHMEDFLRYTLGFKSEQSTNNTRTNRSAAERTERHVRRPILTDDVVEDVTQPAPAWEV